MSRPTETPRAQLDPTLALELHEAGVWASWCNRGQCGGNGGPLLVQGGAEGLAAHLATVHSSLDEEVVDPQ